MTDVFGNVHLGYLVVETQRLTDWRRFGADVVGLHVDQLAGDTTRFRLDDRECRFLLQRGPAEDVTALGWQVDDHALVSVPRPEGRGDRDLHHPRHDPHSLGHAQHGVRHR
jgi:hypothetical protein